MDLIFNLDIASDEDTFTNSKKDVLKFLKIIGVDTRFVSYTPDKLYINNLRFSKFSRKRESTFYKQFPDIKVIRSSLFQKICSKSSKVLANTLKPNQKVLLSNQKNSLNDLIAIILEPYTRKYGIKLVYEGDYDLVVDSVVLDDEINSIFTSIFKGEGIDFKKRDENSITPLINVQKDWIDSFLEMDGREPLKNNNKEDLASSFMEFLDDVAPQYRENVLVASKYIEKKLEVKK